MSFDGKIFTTTITEKPIVEGSYPHTTRAVSLKDNQGVLAAGQILARDTNREYVPYSHETLELGNGDGANKDFTGTLTGIPLNPGSVAISDSTATLKDDGCGRLYGDGTGTINYRTGAVAASFTTAPANGIVVNATAANQPRAVLTREVDTAVNNVGPAVVRGNVVLSNLLVDGAEPSAEDMDKLFPAIVGIKGV